MARDSVGRTFLVAFLVCFACSLLVSATAAGLRAKKERDALLTKYRHVLGVAGLTGEGEIAAIWDRRIEPRLVELASGAYVDGQDPLGFDPRKAANDPDRSHTIAAERDLAGIGTRARYAPVYLVRDQTGISQVVLPVHGKGLWSTLYGYIALAPDLKTITGFGFYEHGETPGLGGEVDNPRWLAQWAGKQALDATGQPRIEVLKGRVDPAGQNARYQVDGLSGATMTSRGVTNLLRYWLGEDGFGPFLARAAKEGLDG